jgi:sulfur-oxidizing protein SoxA
MIVGSIMRILVIVFVFLGVTKLVFAEPEADRLAFAAFYASRFPSIDLPSHKDGAYALDQAKREQWLEMEDFPPYEIAIDDGAVLYGQPFSNGESYAACFEQDGLGIKQNYPYYDVARDEVITLELALNLCREKHGEAALDYSGQPMSNLMAYLAFTSRGNKFSISVPVEGLAAYEAGKQFFYERRGQLNFACSSCHLQSAGGMLRAEILSASIGHATHWPTYRFKWEEVGGLHKRFIECNEQVGAEGLPAQSAAYRNLEYFLTYMNNGMTLNGPASRK